MELYLNKQSPHPQEAIDFLRYASSIEGNQIFTDNSGWLPATRFVKVPESIQAYVTPRDCFTLGMPYTIIGSNVAASLDRYLHLLTGPVGSVDKFVEEMTKVMPAAVRTDLRKEISNRFLAIRPQDVQITALGELARRDRTDRDLPQSRERLESSQTQTEALIYQMQLQLARAGE